LSTNVKHPGGAHHSRFVQRVRRRYAAELALLPPGLPVRETLQQGFDALQAGGLPQTAALRVLRQLALERLAVLDCERGESLGSVTRTMTELAELSLASSPSPSSTKCTARQWPSVTSRRQPATRHPSAHSSG
jgi:[glutamine synthetase] adenylyltransferase / [glutamine synthetase]-adenylyl-L-tyrosine phosphorylase